MSIHIEHYADRAELAEAFSIKIGADLRVILAERGRASLAVSGGSTPGPFLQALSHQPLNWHAVSIMPTDERFVASSSDRSNLRLLRETLQKNEAAKAKLVPLVVESEKKERPEDGLGIIERAVQAHLPLDICVLGMGEDMHTASLFPGGDRLSEALDERGEHIILPMRAPNAEEPRLTLTASVLRQSRALHLLITGKAKYEALDKALSGEGWEKAPVRAVLTAPLGITIHYAE